MTRMPTGVGSVGSRTPEALKYEADCLRQVRRGVWVSPLNVTGIFRDRREAAGSGVGEIQRFA